MFDQPVHKIQPPHRGNPPSLRFITGGTPSLRFLGWVRAQRDFSGLLAAANRGRESRGGRCLVGDRYAPSVEMLAEFRRERPQVGPSGLYSLEMQVGVNRKTQFLSPIISVLIWPSFGPPWRFSLF